MRCQECGEVRKKRLHRDPRTPPLDTKPCLCDDCAIAAEEQVAEDLRVSAQGHEDNALTLRERQAGRKPRRRR